jgi:hypothetical protein
MFTRDIISLVRSYIDEINEGESDWKDDLDLFPYLNAAQSFLATLVRQKNENFFTSRFIFPIVQNQNEYFLPTDCITVMLAENIISGVSGSPPNYVVDEANRTYQIIDPDTLKNTITQWTNRRLANYPFSDASYTLFDESIILNGANSMTGFMRLWYIRHLPGLHYGTVAAASSGDITLAATPTKGTLETEKNVYKGMRIGIFSGPGVGQIRRITAYDPSTRIATIDSAWDSVPNTSSQYDIISPVPPQMHECLAFGGALRATLKVDDDPQKFSNMFTSHVQPYLKELVPRVNQGPRRVRRTRAVF